MFEKLKFWSIAIFSILLVIFIFPVKSIPNYIRYAFYSKNDLRINLSLVNPMVRVVSADPSNKVVLRIEVKDSKGSPVPKAHINVSIDKNAGEVYPADLRTDKHGECIVTYTPPAWTAGRFSEGNTDITITASIYKLYVKSSITLSLTRVPVIYVHGYQSNGRIFDNLKDYLASKGYQGEALNYKSENGVIASAEELKSFIQNQKMVYLSKGIQVKKFDLIAHSMGGLVARYYTCSEDFIKNDDVRKIIFVSVPQKGSYWASIGAKYFDNQGIRDLIPDSDLLIKILPGMLNKGLNNKIQAGSIIGQYDEVVSLESASLEEWNIKTEIFNVGENNLTMDNLLNGNIIEGANHKIILNNKKVFEKIEEMLGTDLPYPALKK